MSNNEAIRRILSLDGGGIKGVIPASLLSRFEEATDKRIIDYFDLIVGTSTGGIIALGLALGIPATEILEFYLKYGPGIFGGTRATTKTRGGFVSLACNTGRQLKHLVRPKYSPERLTSALTGVFGNKKIGDCRTRIVIPAFDSQLRSVYVFKTSHHPKLETDWRESAVDVALATGAAPTYFPQHHLNNGTTLIDGGIWANNPVGLAVVEAIGLLNWRPDDLRVLSIGCSETPTRIPTNPGKVGLLNHTTDLFLMGQTHGSLGTAKLLLGNSDHLLRIQPVVATGEFGLDKIKKIEALRGIGASLARDYLPKIRQLFFDGQREEFVPCHPKPNMF